jgi:diguanylate cyclase (GGDEF)-like protein
MVRLLEGRSRFFWIIWSVLLVLLLGLIDYSTGNEYSFSLFYLLPIALVTWYANPSLGRWIAFLCAVAWLVADISVGENYSRPIIYFWNTLIRLGFFLIVNYLMSELLKAQKIVQSLARIDAMTGTVNSRYFRELLEVELKRSSRYNQPFTLVYLDLDNFKQVNDKYGHMEGDRLLRFIADELKSRVRSTDIIARLGGDEFAILFPSAGQQEAKILLEKIHASLSGQLNKKYSFITISAGAVTYTAVPVSLEETIKLADELMYSIKNSTKNGIKYSLYPE